MHSSGSLDHLLQVEISAIDDLAIRKMECPGFAMLKDDADSHCHHSLDPAGLKEYDSNLRPISHNACAVAGAAHVLILLCPST